MREILTEDGRIFKQTEDGFMERSNGRYGEKISRAEFEKKTEFVKKQDLKDVARDNPRFAEMMWDMRNKK